MNMNLQELKENENSNYKIISISNDFNILNSLSKFLEDIGYSFTSITNSKDIIDKIKNEDFDLMILDFTMIPLHINNIITEIRNLNRNLYILLLIDNQNLESTLDIIKTLDIQGFCEKSSNLNQLLLLIESGINSIKQKKEIEKVNNKLSNMYDKLEQAYLESIQTLRYTVEAKDTYTIGHSNRVSAYSVLIGNYLGLPEKDLKNLDIGGLFHDIGKIGIPDTILRKEIKLTDYEYSEVKNHPSIGAHILSNATVFKEIIPIVKYHHEKYDGTGYPNHLKGTDIPYLARIISIADAFDAMTSKRKYRDSLPINTVLNELESSKGTQFDPTITDTFLDILKNHYNEIEKIQNEFS